MSKLRNFDKNDFYAWGGAEPIVIDRVEDEEVTTPPKIANYASFTIIVDNCSVSIYDDYNTNDGFVWYNYGGEFEYRMEVAEKLLQDIQGKTRKQIVAYLNENYDY